MIFVSLGSREYQFDRLLKEIDKLVEDKVIQDEICAQIGQSTYVPENYRYERFLDTDTFEEYQNKAEIVISHGGTGALIGALKKNKQVIAVPRLEKYEEHLDDHQTEISSVLADMGYLISVTDMKDLGQAYLSLKSDPITKRYERESNIVKIINEFIEENY